MTEAERDIGGKALGLARLAAVGAPVPPWFVIPASRCAAHLGQGDLPELLERAMRELACISPTATPAMERVAIRVRCAVESAPVDAEVLDEVKRGLASLGPGPFAVRSSMVGEDSARLSFAGQLDSFLFQHDIGEVVASLRRCWGSAFSARVLAYRLRTGGGLALPRMGVIVQRMVAGRVSGVAFTAHPVTGRRDQALITAAWGLGEGIVGGLCNTDEYVWDHGGREVSASIAAKDVAVVPRGDGTPGTVEAEVSPGDRDRRCLTPKEVARIGTEAVRVASALGSPQDIEWTFEDDALHLLQSRPITALPVPENTDGPRLVFDNSNIQESYCGVTTPLTFSFASACYAVVYEQTARVLGVPEPVIASMRTAYRNLLGLVRGRVYYNINNWYRGLLLLPSFRRNKADMEKMMGLDRPVDFVADETLTLAEKLKRLPGLLRTLVRLKREIARLPKTVPRWLANFEAASRVVDRRRLPRATFSELMELLEQLRVRILENWHTPILGDFAVMMSTGDLRRLVARSRAGDVEALMNSLLCGENGLESVEPARRLMRLARMARGTPALAEALRTGPAAESLAGARKADPEFANAFDEYVERYGDRCMGELKLETPSLRQDPSFAVQVLRSYLDRPELDADALVEKDRRLRREAEQAVGAGLRPWRRWRLTRVLARARRAVRDREAMRLARTRAFGLERDIYRAIGARLFEGGRLDAAEDVFYLTIEEIGAYHEGRAASAELASITRARRLEFAAYEAQEMPNHFETRGPVYHGNRYEDPDRRPVDRGTSTLQGTGCYPGLVEAPVRIIASPRDELSLDGRILAAVRTDPGWAPLFPTASGVLVERGSTLSHTAVIARELGIPTIVGIPDLVAILSDGERVRMDGSTGGVSRLDARASR